MQCQTILQNALHEKYLLQRMNASEEVEYEKHLRACESCQKELGKQRLLICGIREIGRREMKAEIRRQVDTERTGRSQINWPLLARVAAVFLIFVVTPGVFYYLNQSTGQKMVPVPPELESRMISDAQEDYSRVKKGADRMELDKLNQKSVPKVQGQAASGKPDLLSQSAIVVEPRPKRNEPPESRSSGGISEDAADVAMVAESAEAAAKVVSRPQDGPVAKTANNREDRALEFEAKSPAPAGAESFEANEALRAKKASANPEVSKPAEFLETQEVVSMQGERFETARLSVGAEPNGLRIYFYEKPQRKVDAFMRRIPEGSASARVARAVGDSLATYSVWRFKSNERWIVIHLKVSSSELGSHAIGKLPETFPVKIVQQDSLHLEMNWVVNPELLKIKPSITRIEIDPKQIMRVIFDEGLVYKVDLATKPTLAILQK